jgi:UDP-N-acetylmuramoyl-L-alanyl-D-glutamate--2,6-diaminopimelate ligase
LRLTELIGGDGVRHANATADLDISGLTADSRAVKPGYLFAALEGARGDGRSFIPDALAKGAVAILTDLRQPLPAPVAADGHAVPVLADANPRRSLALMAAKFHGLQPRTVAAVTGTSGKTSTVAFTRQVWATLGYQAASLGTLGIVAPNFERKGALTTPDPVALHADLADLARSGVDHLAIEASSHGLEQCRLDGIDIKAAGFTNLSRDHLDYHPDMQSYLGAKLRLFNTVMPMGRVAVLNADIPEYEALLTVANARRHRVISYGRAGADLRLEMLTPTPEGQILTLNAFGRRTDLLLPIAGAFQAHNALCAIGLAVGCGADDRQALAALSSLNVVPGRIERVATHPSGAPIFVDYAHKPDALRVILETLRPLAKSRLVVVVGCGGDRDRGKRPEMGEIAARLADRTIITDDNPRSEDAGAIRAQMIAGVPAAARGKVREIGDRAKAIATAIEQLDTGDVLVIAGKGHEQGQIVGNTVLPFNDAEEARVVVAALARKALFPSSPGPEDRP